MVKNYSDEQLLARVRQLPSFKRIPKEHWILGIRSSADNPGKFDDKFYEFEGEKFIRVLTGTTHPGLTILSHFEKYNKLGAAVVKSDEWYYDLWKYGLHKNRMPALLQLGNEISVYRDGDKDNKAEENGKVYKGWYGINFHTNTYDWSEKSLEAHVEDIGAWSAGCQVLNEREVFAEMMKYYAAAAKNGTQKTVSYCLLKEF
jgi:hypothetical protein